MPRWVFLLGVGMLLVALAFMATYAVLGPAPGVTEANVRRIRRGMPLAEVESILGGWGRCQVIVTEGCRDTSVFHWTGLEGEAYVLFDDPRAARGSATVLGARFDPAATPTPLDRLRKALGR